MLKKMFIYLIIGYQRFISPFKRMQACKFQPTCSQYMIDAITIHGIVKGILIGLRRLGQCRPHSKYAGFDPVPKLGTWRTEFDTRIDH